MIVARRKSDGQIMNDIQDRAHPTLFPANIVRQFGGVEADYEIVEVPEAQKAELLVPVAGRSLSSVNYDPVTKIFSAVRVVAVVEA